MNQFGSVMDFSKFTVLIVDDEMVYIKLLKQLAGKEIGTKVAVANNPKEAFEYLKHNIPDLILLDMQMPMMDGLSALKLIRSSAATSKIPVIACTAMGNIELVLKLKELNITDYILKTGDIKIYKEKIIAALAKIEEERINKLKLKEDE